MMVTLTTPSLARRSAVMNDGHVLENTLDR